MNLRSAKKVYSKYWLRARDYRRSTHAKAVNIVCRHQWRLMAKHKICAYDAFCLLLPEWRV